MRKKRGTAAVEFALLVPVLLIVLVGAVEVGFLVYQSMQLHNAVEAGSVYVAKNGMSATGISNAVTNATGLRGVTASPAPAQFCGCPSATGVIAATCGSTCTAGGTTGTYVKISASFTHETILSYPGLSIPRTLTAQAIVRLN